MRKGDLALGSSYFCLPLMGSWICEQAESSLLCVHRHRAECLLTLGEPGPGLGWLCLPALLPQCSPSCMTEFSDCCFLQLVQPSGNALQTCAVLWVILHQWWVTESHSHRAWPASPDVFWSNQLVWSLSAHFSSLERSLPVVEQVSGVSTTSPSPGSSANSFGVSHCLQSILPVSVVVGILSEL